MKGSTLLLGLLFFILALLPSRCDAWIKRCRINGGVGDLLVATPIQGQTPGAICYVGLGSWNLIMQQPWQAVGEGLSPTGNLNPDQCIMADGIKRHWAYNALQWSSGKNAEGDGSHLKRFRLQVEVDSMQYTVGPCVII